MWVSCLVVRNKRQEMSVDCVPSGKALSYEIICGSMRIIYWTSLSASVIITQVANIETYKKLTQEKYKHKSIKIIYIFIIILHFRYIIN